MPKILVVHLPDDKIHDELERPEDELGETVEELYGKLGSDYAIEVRQN